MDFSNVFLRTFFCVMILKMVTFNARGLMDMRKFEKVKEMCKREDVIMLQETNWKDLHISEIRKNGMERFYTTTVMIDLEEELQY